MSLVQPDVLLHDELDHCPLQPRHVDRDEGPRHEHRRVHEQDGQLPAPHGRDLRDIFRSTDCKGGKIKLQGGPSGLGTLFVDIKFKVPSQCKLLILKRNS